MTPEDWKSAIEPFCEDMKQLAEKWDREIEKGKDKGAGTYARAHLSMLATLLKYDPSKWKLRVSVEWKLRVSVEEK